MPRVDSVRSPARGSRLAKMECLGHRPAPSAPLEVSLHGVDAGAQRGRRDTVRGFAHKDPICAAGSESFVSVEVAGSNGPRQKLHGDALSVTDWIRLSRLGDVRSPRRCTAKFVRLAALLSLAGGWLAVRTAESSRLLSLPDGKEIEDVRLTLHRKVVVYCRCPHRRARVSHRTGLPRRPRAWCGHGKDEKDTACRTRAAAAPPTGLGSGKWVPSPRLPPFAIGQDSNLRPRRTHAVS